MTAKVKAAAPECGATKALRSFQRLGSVGLEFAHGLPGLDQFLDVARTGKISVDAAATVVAGLVEIAEVGEAHSGEAVAKVNDVPLGHGVVGAHGRDCITFAFCSPEVAVRKHGVRSGVPSGAAECEGWTVVSVEWRVASEDEPKATAAGLKDPALRLNLRQRPNKRQRPKAKADSLL